MLWFIVLAIALFIGGDLLKDGNFYDYWETVGRVCMYLAGAIFIALVIFSIINGILVLT